MKTLAKKFLLLFLFVSFSAYNQQIKIYHGKKGTSEAYVSTTEKDGKSSHKKISEPIHFNPGDTVKIVVVNSHPGLYEYSFDTEEIKVETPEFPDISILTNFLNTELELETPSTKNGRVLKANSELEKGITTGKWPSKYREELKKIKALIKEVEDKVSDSDFPMGAVDALNYNSTGGFALAQKSLMTNELFKKDWDEHFEKWSKTVKSKEEPYKYIPDKTRPEIELTMELYDTYYKTLIAKAKELKNSYGPEVSGTATFEVIIADKQVDVKLSAKPKKNNKTKIRDTEFKISLIPNFNRPTVELVPVVTVSQSSNGKSFGVENGIITSENENGMSFGVGAVFNVNAVRWGSRKEYSFGPGVGFAFVEESLDNFFVNANFNFGDWVRIGLGYGWFQTPTGLKNGLSIGDSIGDVTDIDDIISFTNEPSFIVTIVLPGINLPISK